jgi:hypothetical protein
VLSCAAGHRRLSLPPQDPSLYASIRDARDWKNPYLVVEVTGVRLTGAGVDKLVAVSALPETLATLPRSAWPYGAVVAASVQSIRGDDRDDAPIEANRVALVEVLRAIGVAIEWWPSA